MEPCVVVSKVHINQNAKHHIWQNSFDSSFVEPQIGKFFTSHISKDDSRDEITRNYEEHLNTQISMIEDSILPRKMLYNNSDNAYCPKAIYIWPIFKNVRLVLLDLFLIFMLTHLVRSVEIETIKLSNKLAK